jgi:hypothetical protein
VSDQQENTRLAPPYISWQTFEAFLDRIKGTVTPTRIDSSVLKHLSGTAQSQLQSGLKFLNLVQADSTTTPAFKELVAAYKSPKWKEQLGRVLQDAYSPLIGPLDIKTATPGQLKERFREAGGVEGETVEKCIRFLLIAFKQADIPFSPHLPIRQRSPRQNSGAKRGSKPKAATDNGRERDDDDEKDIAPEGTFKIPLDILRINAVIYLPEDISEARWEQISSYVKTVLSFRTKPADDENGNE